MLKEILEKLETAGDIDAMARGEISIPWPSKERVEALTEEEYRELESAILADSRMFHKTNNHCPARGHERREHMRIIESRTIDGVYGMNSDQAIVEHNGQRLLVCDGYGGENTPHGGMYRWIHGTVNQLLPGDTFSSLAGDWNDITSHMQAILTGNDPDRPLLDWSGFVIDRMMTPKDAMSLAASVMGRKGGSVRSEIKGESSRENGKKGGRPKKNFCPICKQPGPGKLGDPFECESCAKSLDVEEYGGVMAIYPE